MRVQSSVCTYFNIDENNIDGKMAEIRCYSMLLAILSDRKVCPCLLSFISLSCYVFFATITANTSRNILLNLYIRA